MGQHGAARANAYLLQTPHKHPSYTPNKVSTYRAERALPSIALGDIEWPGHDKASDCMSVIAGTKRVYRSDPAFSSQPG